MKKLLLIAAATSALSLGCVSSASAEVDTVYGKVSAGGALLNKITDSATGLKAKSKTAPLFELAIGYTLLDNVRADLGFTYVASPEFKKTGGFSNGSSGSVKHKGNVMALLANGYVDVFNMSAVNLFVGAGVGMSQLKEKVTISDAINSGNNASASSKNKMNFAYQVTVGTSMEVSPGAYAELAYSWRDFGKTKGKTVTTANNTNVTLGSTRYKGHNVTAGIRFDF